MPACLIAARLLCEQGISKDIGKLKLSFWVATMDRDLSPTFPEQSGSSSRAANAYTAKQKAALKKSLLKRFKELLESPECSVDLRLLPKVKRALGA